MANESGWLAKIPTACKRCGLRYTATTGAERRYECGSDARVVDDFSGVRWRHSEGCREIMQMRAMLGRRVYIPPPEPLAKPASYVSVADAAKALGATPNRVRDLVRTNVLTGGKMQVSPGSEKRRVMVDADSLRGYILNGKQAPEDDDEEAEEDYT